MNYTIFILLTSLLPGASISSDTRDIQNGWEIPSEGYCDQPYIVVLDDGIWLCTMTTCQGQEGATSQHVVSTRSEDLGKTWGPLTDIEPAGPPESSWAVPLKTPGGRIYAFYDFNAENIREVTMSNGKSTRRVDTLGQYVCKYSDDRGVSWSAQRHQVPVREFAIDRENVYRGQVRFFWSVAKPLILDGTVFIGFSKVGNFGAGFIERSEGVILKSGNVLTEQDPEKIVWETLPDGDTGLRAPAGPIAEEHNLTALSEGALFCTYRTTQGHPCHAYSRDGGHTWTPPEYMTYEPGGRIFKHPRAANFVRRFGNGKYLYWFHNHGGGTYDGRNPVWLCGGIEKDGFIQWSQPEIALYDDDLAVRMSYPDFIEDQGRIFVSETQKSTARVHEIAQQIPEGLWNQFSDEPPVKTDAALEIAGEQLADAGTTPMPKLPALAPGTGFSLEIRLSVGEIAAEFTPLDTRDAQGHGLALGVLPNRSIVLTLADGVRNERYESDPGVLTPGMAHTVTIIADGGPRVLLVVVDGILCDGAAARPQGWYRLDPSFSEFNGAPDLSLQTDSHVEVQAIRIYTRALRVSDAVANHRGS